MGVNVLKARRSGLLDLAQSTVKTGQLLPNHLLITLGGMFEEGPRYKRRISRGFRHSSKSSRA